MGDGNDLEVAKQLGRIEAQLESLSSRLFGDEGNPEAGLIGQHDKRIAKLERLVIMVAAGLGVFNFITGSGPATLGAIFRVVGGGGGVKAP
jgi:hypothetical protein